MPQQVIIVTEQEVRIRKQKELHLLQEKHKIKVVEIAYQIKVQEVRLDIQTVHQQDHALRIWKIIDVSYTKKEKYFALKVALFASGISGIVAEYILSTLTSYFIGNAILQFTLIASIMLFAIGLGSRFGKQFTKNVIVYFIITEVILTVLVSFSALISNTVYGVTDISWLVIYLLSIFIGLLIGLEIPFATRINDEFEELRLNISNILEKDYFGSLIGRLFFAFIGLPYLGLTYTPFVLGFLNLIISLYLFKILKEYIDSKTTRKLQIAYILVTVLITTGVYFATPIIQFGEQVKYKDKIVYSKQTKYQKL